MSRAWIETARFSIAAAIALFVIGCGAAVPGNELFLRSRALSTADAIVVLGNRPPRASDGSVAPETGRRVAHGVELFERGLAPRLVMAGGPAPGGGTEADVMAARAIELGVPRESIVRETRSRDTAENAGYTVATLCAREGRAACEPSVIVVSTPYHLRRAVRLFRCAGARVQWSASALPDHGDQIGYTAYEYAVALFGGLFDPCGRAAAIGAGR